MTIPVFNMTATANPHSLPSSKPILIVCMGVSGCGKSTLASRLSSEWGFEYIEADDFHPDENKSRMASGQPLTDDMRDPWIRALMQHLQISHEQNRSCVMAFSGLRRAHRQKFRFLGFNTLFVHLKGPKELIRQRLTSRANHFMPPHLIDSQFAALECTMSEKDIVEVAITPDIEQVAQSAIHAAQHYYEAHATK